MIDARGIATALHDGQEDKAGAPYIQHLRAVVGILLRRWPDAPERAVEAAWLHDSLEDTVATPESLRAVGVSSEAIALVQQLTRPSGMPYAEYIARLAADGDLWAIRIKLADNEHNSDPARRLPGSDLLERRYLPARRVLEAALAGRFPQPARDENRETPPAPTRRHEGNGEQALPRAAVSGRDNERRSIVSDKTSVRTSGMSTSGLLGVVFVTLKLCGVIHWSWWWVTAPFWVGPAVLLAIGILCGAGFWALCGIEVAIKLLRRRKALAAREALLARRGTK
jgi:hypothetical protein